MRAPSSLALGRCLLATGIAATLIGGACAEPKGSIMLAITTDMRAPKDVNAVSVTISNNGRIKHSFIGRVTPQGEVLLPATLAITEPDDKNASIRIRVMAFQDRKPRVLRDVRTTVPRGRSALLRVPLTFVNDGSAVGEPLPEGVVPDPVPGTGGVPSSGAVPGVSAADFDFFGAFQPPCDDIENQTVIDGVCQDSFVDATKLPELVDAQEQLGDSTVAGSCFDVARCFSSASSAATFDPGSCTVTLPGVDPARLNLAVVTPDTGACVRPGECYVPLDRGAPGWSDVGGRVQLPSSVCTLLDKKKLRLAIATDTCPAKLDANPICTPKPGEVEGLADGGTSVPAPSDGGATRPDASASFDAGAPTEPSPVDGGGVDAGPIRPRILQLDGGGYYTCALFSDGAVKCWGDNEQGQLGDGTKTRRLVPTTVPGLTGVAQLSTGYEHACARMVDGTLQCWGNNTYGQLGDNTQTQRSTPGPVTGMAGVQQVAAGLYFSCARVAGGAVQCWGYNDHGEVGDGTTTRRLVPTPTGLVGTTDLAAGGHACARMTDDSLKCWGQNFSGQIGDGTTSHRPNPTTVPGIAGVRILGVKADSTFVLLADGSVRAWGWGSYGQMGNGTFTDTNPSPVTLPGLSLVADLKPGSAHACTRFTDGTTMSCWGHDGWGQLGDDSTTHRATPGPVPGLAGVEQIFMGHQHTCALLGDGSVRCWGQNNAGQLGDGTTTDRHVPTLVAF